MAKKTVVKITGIAQARDNALKFLNQTKKDSKILNTEGQFAADQIRNRTRGRLEEYKQNPITKGTSKRRESLIKSGNFLDERLTRPKQSNLTLSGQLLGAITYKINSAFSEIIIFLNPTRKAYRGARGFDLENSKDNVEIKKDLESRGRRFLFLSDRLRTNLENRLVKELKRRLDLYNKIKRKLSL
jgi:hypothetical protein